MRWSRFTTALVIVGMMVVVGCGDEPRRRATDPIYLDVGGADTGSDVDTTPPCEDDGDCPGLTCDLESGRCVGQDCEYDRDCPGGFRCDDGSCLPIDPIVCLADSTRCDDNTLVTCASDGTTQDHLDCDPDACLAEEDGARCAERVCQPLAVGCLDGDTAFTCDETGAVRTETQCADGQYCDRGTCEDQICEPDSQRCDGAVVVACNQHGSAESRAPCSATAACAESDLGCGCRTGTCVERVCRPGTARCVGDSRQPCADNGLSYEAVENCDDDQICAAGECLPEACEPGSRDCAGDVLLVCESDATSRAETNCTDSDRICQSGDDTAACSRRLCVPDQVQCDRDRTTVLTCDARGASTSAVECDADENCAAGFCIEDVCDQDSPRECVEGDVWGCDAIGSAFVMHDNCDDVTEFCREGACRSVVCVADQSYCAQNELFTCSADGTRNERTRCADSSQYCAEVVAACLPWVCTPGSDAVCLDGDAQQCNSVGSGFTVIDTCSDFTEQCEAGHCEQINACPDADASASASTVQVGEEVTASASGSTDDDGSVVSYQWDWGDGEVSNGVEASHTYASAGFYSVTLIVTDDDGCTYAPGAGETASARTGFTVRVTGHPPMAELSVDASDVEVGDTVRFDASGSFHPGAPVREIVRMVLNFGDGTTRTVPGDGVVDYSFSSPGEFTVTLTVVDDQELRDTDQVVITVREPEIPELVGRYHLEAPADQLCGLSPGTGEYLVDYEFSTVIVEELDGAVTVTPSPSSLPPGELTGTWDEDRLVASTLFPVSAAGGCQAAYELDATFDADRDSFSGTWRADYTSVPGTDCAENCCSDCVDYLIDANGSIGCDMPSGACGDGGQSRRGCGGARVIGRNTAGALDGVTLTDSTCSAHDDWNDESACWDANKDHSYRLYLLAGERVDVRLRTGSSCHGEVWNGTLRIVQMTDCAGDECGEAVFCDYNERDVATTYVAPQDGWVVIVADGSHLSGDAGTYSLIVELSCEEDDCGCD